MNTQQACEVIWNIEQKLDVNEPKVLGVHLWPFVRIALWDSLLSYSNEERTAKRLNGLKSAATSILRNFISELEVFFRKFQYLKIGKVDLLFLSPNYYYSEIIKGKKYSRVIDPFYELCQPYYKCYKVHFGKNSGSKLIPSSTISVFSSKKYDEAVVSLINMHSDFLAGVLSASKSELQLLPFKKLIESKLSSALYGREIATALINSTKPKAIFSTCYYDPVTLGVMWAAYENHIPSVDIQHGKQGKYQAMYSHWSRIPDSGYAVLPAWLWNWGGESRDNIMRWQPERSMHRSEVVGFPWIEKWKSENEGIDKLKTGKVNILVTLQPLKEEKQVFPNFLLEAIKQSPDEWFWVIRPHNNSTSGEEYVRHVLNSIQDEKYSISMGKNNSLYDLLAASHIHMTAYSTVCYEASAFGVPTILFSEEGRDIYDKEIQLEVFQYADSANDIISTIKSLLKRESFIQGNYLEKVADIKKLQPLKGLVQD